MIVAIHIPKTAGSSFRSILRGAFGDRICFDYGDGSGLNTPELNARRTMRADEMRGRRDELLRDYDAIYGHFIADKYLNIFPQVHFSAFLRDPYQQTASLYHFLSRDHPGKEYVHPAVAEFKRVRPTLPEFVAVAGNVQSGFLGKLTVSDLAMVGLTEQYERSSALFGAVFNREMQPTENRVNVNPQRQHDRYEINESLRKAVDRHSAADVEAYRRACELFTRLTARYDV